MLMKTGIRKQATVTKLAQSTNSEEVMSLSPSQSTE